MSTNKETDWKLRGLFVFLALRDVGIAFATTTLLLGLVAMLGLWYFLQNPHQPEYGNVIGWPVIIWATGLLMGMGVILPVLVSLALWRRYRIFIRQHPNA